MRLNSYHPARFRGISAARISWPIAMARQSRRSSGSAAPTTVIAFLAACHAQLGDAASAKPAAQEVLQRAPDFSAERFIAIQHYKHKSDREHHRAALLRAQLPA